MRQAQINIKLTKGDVVDILQNERYFFLYYRTLPLHKENCPWYQNTLQDTEDESCYCSR